MVGIHSLMQNLFHIALRGIKKLFKAWRIKDSTTPVAVYINLRFNKNSLAFDQGPITHALSFESFWVLLKTLVLLKLFFNCYSKGLNNLKATQLLT